MENSGVKMVFFGYLYSIENFLGFLRRESPDLSILLIMLFYSLEGFVADYVLDFTSIVVGSFLVDTKAQKGIHNNGVTLKNCFGYFKSAFGQGDIALTVNGNMTIFFKKPHCPADAGL